MHHRQILLGRRQDDEAAVDFIGVEIVVSPLHRRLRRKAGAVDMESSSLVGLRPNAFSASL